jgi:hypothetical protein
MIDKLIVILVSIFGKFSTDVVSALKDYMLNEERLI